MNIISFTDAALTHVKNLIAKNADLVGFRLSIKKTGCSGYAYVPDLISKVNEQDLHFNQENLKIYIAADCAEFIKGLIVDYVKEGIGLKQERLVFINPNEKNRCGCGESFTVE